MRFSVQDSLSACRYYQPINYYHRSSTNEPQSCIEYIELTEIGISITPLKRVIEGVN